MNPLLLGCFILFLMTGFSYGQDSRFAYGGPSEKEIRERIVEAKHCEVKEDCVRVELGCPYECNLFLHKDKAAQIEKDAEESRRLSGTQCDYQCVRAIGHDCVVHQCVAILEK